LLYNVAMGILDIVIIVLAILSIIIGLYKGLAGAVFGFLGTLICLALGLVAGYFLSPFAVFNQDRTAINSESSLVTAIYTPISDSVSGLSPVFSAEIISTENGVTISYEGNTMSLAEALESAGGDNAILSAVMKYTGSILPTIVASNAVLGMTVGQVMGIFVTRLAFTGIIGLSIFIVLFIVKRIIRRSLFKWLDAHSTPSKVDRALGAVFLVVLLLAIIWTAGYFMFGKGGEGNSITAYVESSPITYKLMTTANPILLIINSIAGA